MKRKNHYFTLKLITLSIWKEPKDMHNNANIKCPDSRESGLRGNNRGASGRL